MTISLRLSWYFGGSVLSVIAAVPFILGFAEDWHGEGEAVLYLQPLTAHGLMLRVKPSLAGKQHRPAHDLCPSFVYGLVECKHPCAVVSGFGATSECADSVRLDLVTLTVGLRRAYQQDVKF